MLYNEPSPLETKVLTRRFEMENSASELVDYFIKQRAK